MRGVDKVFAPLSGRPLIWYSLQALDDAPEISRIVLVLSQANLAHGEMLVKESGWSKVVGVCVGGERRQDSVLNGLRLLPDCQFVVVHDGARPFLDSNLISQGVYHARETGAAVAAVPVVDTLKAAGPDMTVTNTVSREGLWTVQTPQVFRRDLLERAHGALSEDVTDDASMVERIGAKVRVYPGSRRNIKVTTPDDLDVAEAMFQVAAQADARSDT